MFSHEDSKLLLYFIMRERKERICSPPHNTIYYINNIKKLLLKLLLCRIKFMHIKTKAKCNVKNYIQFLAFIQNIEYDIFTNF
jgi:hypothetical protein